MQRGFRALALGVMWVIGATASGGPAAVASQPENRGAEVSDAVHSDVSAPLRDAHVASPAAAGERERPLRRVNPGAGHGPDGALQTSTGADLSQAGAGVGFEGVGNGVYGFEVL